MSVSACVPMQLLLPQCMRTWCCVIAGRVSQHFINTAGRELNDTCINYRFQLNDNIDIDISAVFTSGFSSNI